MKMLGKVKFRTRYLFIFLLVVTLCLAVGSLAMAAGDTTAPVVTSVTPVDGSTIYANGGLTVYYQLGNTTPLVIKADYSDEAGGSGVDVNSVMVHLDRSNMLSNCPVQTATHVECVATAADLFPGTHPLDIYVADVDGNLNINRTYVTVTVDNVAPSYSNLTPVDGSIIYTSQLNSTSINDMSALRINYDLIDPDPSSGWSPMSHVNESVPPGVAGAMILNASCLKTPTATNPTHYSCQMNRAKLLHLGDNTLSILLKDKVGNTSSDYSDATSLKHYTVVDDVAPVVSGLTADATTIAASYNDPAPTGSLSTSLTSGTSPSTAMVHVDGEMIMVGCSATATGISCMTPTGLAGGTHAVEVMVKDAAGNMGMATGTLNICEPAKPNLGISRISATWGSYTDYLAGQLTVRYLISNNGTNGADNVTLTGSVNTNGVTLSSPVPANYGSLIPGASVEFPVQYYVPASVGSFMASVTASASDPCGASYTYPI